MSVKTWTLTDVSKEIHLESWNAGPKDVEGSAGDFSVELKTLRGGMSEGVQTLRVTAGEMAVVLLPSRGMSLWKAWRGSVEAGWRSPVQGPVHPSFVPLSEPGGLGWLDGFDELLTRCGLENNGAPEFDESTNRLTYPLHGRIGNKVAHKLTVDIDGETGEITVTGVVDEVRFHFLKLRLTTVTKLKVGDDSIRIHDTVTNLSASEAECQILYHTNFGEPLLDGGSQVVVPAKVIVPRNDHAATNIASWSNYSAPQPGFEEQVYFFEVLGDENGQTQILLKNAHSTSGASLHYNVKQLPCYTVWKNTTASEDGYVTGLEPGTNFPNPRTYEGEQGRTKKLAGGASTEFDLRIQLHTETAEIEAAETAIMQLQGGGKVQVHDKPQKGWCHGV